MKINNKLRIKAVEHIIFKQQDLIENLFESQFRNVLPPTYYKWVEEEIKFQEESLKYWENKLENLKATAKIKK